MRELIAELARQEIATEGSEADDPGSDPRREIETKAASLVEVGDGFGRERIDEEQKQADVKVRRQVARLHLRETSDIAFWIRAEGVDDQNAAPVEPEPVRQSASARIAESKAFTP